MDQFKGAFERRALRDAAVADHPYTGLLADADILGRTALPDDSPWRLRIDPFFGGQVKVLADGSDRPCVSYGLTSCGYDVRLGLRFRRLRTTGNLIETLPKDRLPEPVSPFADQSEVWGPEFVMGQGEFVTIEPHGCVLAETLEYIRVPEDVGVLVLCKSTWARCFITLNTTPLEPGWDGTVTLEIHNQSHRPVSVFAGHGIGQLWFNKCVTPPLVPYNARKNPTYQGQRGPTPAKLKA